MKEECMWLPAKEQKLRMLTHEAPALGGHVCWTFWLPQGTQTSLRGADRAQLASHWQQKQASLTCT